MDTTAFELSLEQELQMRIMEDSAQGLTKEEMLDLLMQTSRMLMIKDNLIRNMIRHGAI
jgi:Phycobilisome degradation protein nblA